MGLLEGMGVLGIVTTTFGGVTLTHLGRGLNRGGSAREGAGGVRYLRWESG